jgi:hypothetical protein
MYVMTIIMTIKKCRGIEADYAVYNAIISKTNAQKQEQEQAERRQ